MDKREWALPLERHRAADDREGEHLASMKALLQETNRPFSRDQFEPGHFTASAFVLSPDANQLLLIFHDKLERWLQPGGHVDPGDETFLSAALRELMEETGLGAEDVSVANPAILDVDVHQIPPNPQKGEPMHRHFDVRILFEAKTVQAMAGSDARAVRWVAFEDVGLLETDESVMRAVRKIVAMGGG